MSKLIEISTCRQCRYMKEYLKTMPRCMWPHKMLNRNLEDSYSIPDWCPLPDALHIETNTETRCPKCGETEPVLCCEQCGHTFCI